MAIDFRVAAATGVIALVTAAAASAAEVDRTIVLHVNDYANLRAGELRNAQDETSRIYSAAGVRILWTDGTHPANPGGADLTVVFLNKEMMDRKIATEGGAAGVLGQAARPTRRAYIFYARVEALAAKHSRATATVLGRVIAHEVGHLLLMTDGHTETGIMRAQLNLFALVERFTVPQAAMLRSRPAELRAAR